MTSLEVPRARTTRSDSVISLKAGDETATSALQRGSTGQLGTLIDLLNATAHDPDLDHDSDSDADDTDEAPTPADSIHHGHQDDAHVFDHAGTPALKRPGLGARQGSISSLARKMHFSSLEDSEDMVDLAREARNDNDEQQDLGLDADAPQTPSTAERDPVDSPEGMLARLVEEYGPWTDDSERFVMQIPGALYRDVLIKGLLALTNRRLLLYAYIPPPEPRDVVLKAGPVTAMNGPVNGRSCFLGKKSRVWLELRSDSATWFASSAKLYKPLGSHRLSTCRAVLPYDPEHPKIVQVEGTNGRVRAFEYDTAESAIQWRAEIEAALFTFRATADKLRLSLPLQYVTKIGIQPYGPIAESIRLEFDTVTPCSEQGPEQPASQSVEFGYLRTHSEFGDALKKHIEETRQLPPCGGPQPILEIEPAPESIVAQAEDSVHTDLSDKSLAAQFCRRFALPDSPTDLYVAKQTELVRAVPTWGSLALSRDYLMFWRKGAVGADVMYRYPLKDVEDSVTARAFGFKIWGLAVHIRGTHDIRFDFVSQKKRDEVIEKIKEAALRTTAANVDELDSRSSNESARMPSFKSRQSTDSAQTTGTSTPTTPISPQAFILPEVHLNYARTRDKNVILGQDLEENPEIPVGLMAVMPTVLGSSARRKFSNLHFFCLTIGSRGDVQPYISLGLELMKDGNQVTIASHPEYREWVEGFGIGYKDVGGDPGALMKLSVEHRMFSPGFFKESLGHFRKWLDDLFHESWVACQGADVLIESPSTMCGIHVAEALGIPYFRAFTMPWTSTSAYPQAFASGVDLGPGYNLMSYSLYEGIIWKATAGQVNRWRKDELGLKATSEKKMKIAQVPFIYNFSSAVVPRPNDWRDNITISGYWFLPPNEDLSLNQEVVDFIDQARADGKPLIYVGFGSIVVQDAAALTRAVVAAVTHADVRCILSKGWSERHATKHDEVPLPDTICSVPSVAHDLLFPLIDAACHHGGAGTTGASLRAGLPTLIHPFFGDQHFWASRVTKLGAGIKIDTLNEKELTTAFKRATTERIMREKAEAIGVKIRSENGPRAAINFIYDHLHLAQVTSSARAARAAGQKFAEPRVQTQVFAQSIEEGGSVPGRGPPARASTLPIALKPFERSSTKFSTQSAPVAEH